MIANHLMGEYCKIYGPEGEFNESPFYAASNRLIVGYYQAERFWSGALENRLAKYPFPEASRWIVHTTLPPGRPMCFGDCKPESSVQVGYLSAVAAANQDPVLQWFYRKYGSESTDPRDFLWPDYELGEVSPNGLMPLGKAYSGHGGILVSRSDWDPLSPTCIVYGKSGMEPHHHHHDMGQLCIDALGERLIADIGSPSGYPADYFIDSSRWKYYNASSKSHNVLIINDKEQENVQERYSGGKTTGLLWSNFDELLGGAWKIDLTPAYPDAERVERIMVHLFPGIVAILDSATTIQKSHFALRWHTTHHTEIFEDGSFIAKGNKAVVIGKTVALSDSNMFSTLKNHEYKPPYDHDRLGYPLAQRKECFYEVSATGNEIRWLTLFAVKKSSEILPRWKKKGNDWCISYDQSSWRVKSTDKGLVVKKDNTSLEMFAPI